MANRKKQSNPALLLALLALAGVAALWIRINGSKPGGASKPVRKPTPTALAVPQAPARLALVLDDWGYSTRQLPRLKDFQGKLTVAVIPGLPFSKKAAETAHLSGAEVIMHLPVEPLAKMPLAAGTLMVGMSEAEVDRLCDGHAQSVPFMVGLNNHEGSKGSADPALMGSVARWLKGRHGYFLDSVTTPKSQIPDQARKAGIPWARNRVFLDNAPDPLAIEKELRKSMQIALQTGTCIAIGHDRPATLEALIRLEPEIHAAGVTLVFVSELVQNGETHARP